MKKSILVLLFFGVVVFVYGQVPGFMGKRLSISANGYFGPSFDQPVSVKPSGAGIFLNKKISIGVDYVIGRKWTVGLEVQQLNTATKLWFDNGISSIRNTNYKLNSTFVSLGFSRFFSKSDFIAPVGRYFTFGAMVVNFTLFDEKGVVFAPKTKLLEGHDYGVFFGFGRKRIYNRRFIVDYAMQSGAVFGKSLPPYLTDDANFFLDVRYRLFYASLLNFKIGVGYLL